MDEKVLDARYIATYLKRALQTWYTALMYDIHPVGHTHTNEPSNHNFSIQ